MRLWLPALGSFLLFGTAAAFTQGRTQPEFGNHEALVLVLDAAGPGTYFSTDQFNRWGDSLELSLNISAASATPPALTPTVQGKDAASGQYYTICQGPTVTGEGFTSITVFPGATAAPGICAAVLPATWRLEIDNPASDSWATLTAGASTGR
jgi:hypothetical protein